MSSVSQWFKASECCSNSDFKPQVTADQYSTNNLWSVSVNHMIGSVTALILGTSVKQNHDPWANQSRAATADNPTNSQPTNEVCIPVSGISIWSFRKHWVYFWGRHGQNRTCEDLISVFGKHVTDCKDNYLLQHQQQSRMVMELCYRSNKVGSEAKWH